MEILMEILNSENIGKICIILIILLLFCGYALQKGWVRGKIKNFVIGNDDERRIIREQLMWSKSELDVYFNDLIYDNKENPKFQKEKCLYCKLLVFVIIANCIALNHISTDEIYMNGVISRVWGELSAVELSEKFITEEFRLEQKKEIEKIIKKLVEIRYYYQKEKK